MVNFPETKQYDFQFTYNIQNYELPSEVINEEHVADEAQAGLINIMQAEGVTHVCNQDGESNDSPVSFTKFYKKVRDELVFKNMQLYRMELGTMESCRILDTACAADIDKGPKDFRLKTPNLRDPIWDNPRDCDEDIPSLPLDCKERAYRALEDVIKESREKLLQETVKYRQACLRTANDILAEEMQTFDEWAANEWYLESGPDNDLDSKFRIFEESEQNLWLPSIYLYNQAIYNAKQRFNIESVNHSAEIRAKYRDAAMAQDRALEARTLANVIPIPNVQANIEQRMVEIANAQISIAFTALETEGSGDPYGNNNKRPTQPQPRDNHRGSARPKFDHRSVQEAVSQLYRGPPPPYPGRQVSATGPLPVIHDGPRPNNGKGRSDALYASDFINGQLRLEDITEPEYSGNTNGQGVKATLPRMTAFISNSDARAAKWQRNWRGKGNGNEKRRKQGS
jgi:hypothetical protein